MTDGGPAFPRHVGMEESQLKNFGGPQLGMSRRAWLAGMALQGIMSGATNWKDALDHVPLAAWGLADAMLAFEAQEGK